MSKPVSNSQIGVILFLTPKAQKLQSALVETLQNALAAAKRDQDLPTTATLLALNTSLTEVTSLTTRYFGEHRKVKDSGHAIRENEIRAEQAAAITSDEPTPDIIA